nr:protein UXT homolog isoform X3 [Ziziphus jujuba var. spinosa]
MLLLNGTRCLNNKRFYLRRNIENLEKNSVTSLRTLVNLGSEVYMQADVPDTKRIFVDVGLGFHVEFTWSEALNYISLREEKLSRQIEEYTHLIASIKAQIKLVFPFMAMIFYSGPLHLFCKQITE